MKPFQSIRYPQQPMKLSRRFSIRALLVFVGLFAVALAICLNQHSRSMERYEAVSRLRQASPVLMIYFDQMVDWDQDREAYSIKAGDVSSLPPVGWQKTFCDYFEHDYVCPPRVIVFIDPPDHDVIGLLQKLPTVKQIVVLNATSTQIKTWSQELPGRTIQTWKEFRANSSKGGAG